jgi:DNA adenine methylase
MNSKQVKPFLKWAGGKTQLLNDIESKFPYKKNDEFSYIEPFVGSGAVLFWVLNKFPNLKSVVINDINEDLIKSYKTIKSNVNDLILVLKNYEREYHSLSELTEEKKEYYYKKRKIFNAREVDPITQTALFIFLNRTCFNGLYRVNRKNEFNVPIGSYKKPVICYESNLLLVSEKMQKVKILSGDFEQTANYASENSLFYFDPPYKPLSETSSFNSYAKDEFNDNEQIRLKQFCDKLNSLNTKWILSNSDVKGKNSEDDFFDNLFCDYQINRVLAKRSINANPKKRGELTELLILNQGVCNAI